MNFLIEEIKNPVKIEIWDNPKNDGESVFYEVLIDIKESEMKLKDYKPKLKIQILTFYICKLYYYIRIRR